MNSLRPSSAPFFHDERKQLRQQLRARRRGLTSAQQRLAAQNLFRQLVQHPVFRRARHVGLYIANDGEISLHLLQAEAQKRGKNIYLPVVARWPERHMGFQCLDETTCWQKNRFGIAEPIPDQTCQRPLWTLDLLCLPLVGFDASGGRLGMGGGFYDRALAACNLPLPYLLGVAHACQQVEALPLASWDMPMDAVVTDQDWFYPGA